MKINYTLSPFLLFFFLNNTSFTQNFQRTFGNSGGEIGTCIKSTLDGNYIISGMSSGFSNGYEDAYLLKMDTGGNIVWSKAYGGTYQDKAYNVASCSDGGFMLTGYTSVYATSSNWDLLMLKTDSDGNNIWSRSVGGSKDDFGWYVTETNDGGFLSIGATKSFNIGNWDGYVVKTDASGTLQWTKVLGGSNSDYFHGMSKTSDGGFILTGITSTNSFGSSDIWLVKLNSIGDTLWTRQYGKATEDAGNAVIQTNDGGYMIAGDIHVNPNAGNHNSCLLKTDSNGNLQWAKTYGSNPGTEIAWDLRQTSNGDYLLFGSSAFYGNGGGGDMLTIKTDNSGNLKWAKAYGSTAFDDFWYSQKSAGEGTMMVGSSSAGTQNVFVISTDSLGNSACNTTSVVPDVNTPVLQVRSGTIVTTGGLSGTPTILTYSVTTISSDPCTAVTVSENESLNQNVFVYPNPFMDKAVVYLPEIFSPETKFKLFDVFGKEVHPTIIRNPEGFIIYRGDLSSGIYFYKLETINRTEASGKVIIL